MYVIITISVERDVQTSSKQPSTDDVCVSSGIQLSVIIFLEQKTDQTERAEVEGDDQIQAWVRLNKKKSHKKHTHPAYSSVGSGKSQSKMP